MIEGVLHEFRRHQRLANEALVQVTDEHFFMRPGEQANSLALIVKHLGGNLRSRWTDFLTSDGDKPNRDRDREFVLEPDDTRAQLMQQWEQGWQCALGTIAALSPEDLDRTITIRGEPHSVEQALLRGLSHAAYHVGQILFLVRLFEPSSRWLTIPPGQSRAQRGRYL